MAHLKPFQLLEINIISAQDLEPVSRNMKTYASAWVHPKRRLSTSVDSTGRTSPTWNDKFVFRVDDDFLRTDTSAVMIEIHAVHWLRDVLVGTVRVLVGNLVPPPVRPHLPNHHHIGMRFVALQVRRPSGRPQGILNIGVAVLDSSMRSMPLYTQLSTSAVGYRDLMDDDHLNNHHHGAAAAQPRPIVKPILRRSKSERSERVTFDDLSTANGSILALKEIASSLLSESTVNPSKGKGKKGKASSVISGAELREKTKEKSKKGKASSVIGSITSKDSNKANTKTDQKPISDPTKEKKTTPIIEKPKPIEPKNKKGDEKIITSKEVPTPTPTTTAIGKPVSEFSGFEYGGPKGSSIVNGKYIYRGPKAHSFWSDSEVGPSPSEVAAVMAARERHGHPVDDNQSSVLDGWSLDESVEGLRSKLERWRTELPPLYDRSGFGSSSYRSTSQHVRRHSDDGGLGLFSCFGNVYGYECQCICGKPPEGRRSLGSRFQSPAASAGRSFV